MAKAKEKQQPTFSSKKTLDTMIEMTMALLITRGIRKNKEFRADLIKLFENTTSFTVKVDIYKTRMIVSFRVSMIEGKVA